MSENYLGTWDERQVTGEKPVRRRRKAVDKSPIGTALEQGSPEVGGATDSGAPVSRRTSSEEDK